MEREFVDWLRKRIPAHLTPALGVGDDAALVEIAGQSGGLITTDLLMDGVDFDLRECDPRRAGRKALAVNLSDIAAMAGRPLAAVIALALPRDGALELAKALYEGLIPLAERFQVAIAGGDTNTWTGPLAVSVTLLGVPGDLGPLRRDGAHAGDAIVVTGQFGGSLLGRHFDFEPRLAEARVLQERFGALGAIDVSDGLSLDLARFAAASGLGAAIDLSRVPIAPAAAERSRQLTDGSTPLDHALADGEDFELILAMPPQEAERAIAAAPFEVSLTVIGEFVREPGLWSISPSGARLPLVPSGYEH